MQSIRFGLTRVLVIMLGSVACHAMLPAHAAQQCQTESIAVSLPTDAFVDQGDGTVMDQRSKLVWMRCAAGQVWREGQCDGQAEKYSWQAAQAVAGEVNRQGAFFYNDWRVPALRDLAMITERQCQNPRTNLAVFPGTPADFFWTSSALRDAFQGDRFYALDFGAQGVQLKAPHEMFYLRLVRNAH
jgi:hypothetical protein